MAIRRSRPALADKQAQLARGEPWIVHPREVAKSTAAYRTDPEILLGCIIVSGTLDTAEVLSAIVQQDAGIALDAGQDAAYRAFRRVWDNPTTQERAKVIEIASRIAGKPRKDWIWTPPA